MNTSVFLRSLVFLFTFGALVACDSDNNSSSPPAPEEPVAEPPAPELGSIVDVARDAGSFSTLLTALEAAGLDATLAGGKKYSLCFISTRTVHAGYGKASRPRDQTFR